MRYDIRTGRYVEGPMVGRRIKRLINRISHNKTISGSHAVEVARKAARKWASAPISAVKAIRDSGFSYDKPRSFGVYRGRWLGLGVFASGCGYAEAHEEALKEGRQFIRDYKEKQLSYLLQKKARVEQFIQQLRRIERNLGKGRTRENSTNS
jgi:hypothetical protein